LGWGSTGTPKNYGTCSDAPTSDRQDIKISQFSNFTNFSAFSIGCKYFFSKPEHLGSDMLAKITRELVLWDTGVLVRLLPGIVAGSLPGGWSVHHTVNDDMGYMDTLKR
jgi:hypothetical protein